MEKIMLINIIYFASLKDASNKTQEKVETNANSIQDLYSELNEKYHFQINQDQLRVAQNEEYVSFETPLNNNDTIVFIPPVAGG
jgi:molybdopterin synthase sulfur carrier subunit